MVIAAGLSFLVLELTTESFLVPVFFLLSIGTAIVYNRGSNVFLGQVSYITKALTAVLQLGVTMDYSIFLLNSFEENKRRFPDDRTTAMGFAISNTFRSIVGSSVTTIAGFAAYTMTPLENDVLTAELKISFLRAAWGYELIARGFVIKPGRRLHFCECEIYCDDKLVGKASGTFCVVESQVD